MDRDRRQQIREAIVRAYHAVLLGPLRHEVWPDDSSLQLVGEGLLGALASHHDAQVPARICAAALRERDWGRRRTARRHSRSPARCGHPVAATAMPGLDLDQLAAALHANE